jgi:hypothetical protein
MNAHSAVGTISALFEPGASRPALRSRWILLYGHRPRYLLIPNHKLAVQRRCVRVFRRGLGALAGELALMLDRVLPGCPVPLGFEGPAIAQATWLVDLPLDGVASAAVQVGTPGPYQKASVLLLDDNGQALGLAKVAMGPQADRMVKRESIWLTRLQSNPEIAAHIPRLLAQGNTARERSFIATDIGPAHSGNAELGDVQRQFLIRLAHTSIREGSFASSLSRRRLCTALAQLAPYAPMSAIHILRSAIRDCDQALETWSGPLVIAHGDFTPWNTRHGKQGIYVFDWEYAWDEANPAYDALHWMLLPQALGKNGLSIPAIRSVRATITGYLTAAFPDREWSPTIVSGLILQYLLDILLFYSTADDKIDLEHPVHRNYFWMIEGRDQWMV